MRWRPLLPICLLLTSGAARAEGDAEAAVRARLQQYEKSWAAQRFSEVWGMMSPRLRAGSENDESKFVRSIRESGVIVTRIRPSTIRVAAERATVQAVVTYGSPSGQELGEQVEESQWILDRGEWLVDDYKAVAPPP